MTTTRFVLMAACVVLAFETGCGVKKKEITELDRKQAAVLISEAQFSINLRRWADAETALVQAVEKVPDAGPYWVSLGTTRVRLGKRAEAKAAYEGALKAYEAEAKADKTDHNPWLQQVYVLSLLGRVDAARALVDKMPRQFPNDPEIKVFVESKQFDQMLADARFKEVAL